jgi:hypothetical protein
MAQDKPFSLEYVIGVTSKHMLKSIDISINKTFERTRDEDLSPDKVTEAFKTLSILHQMRAQLDERKINQYKEGN